MGKRDFADVIKLKRLWDGKIILDNTARPDVLTWVLIGGV
jgi:hypothetical protein